MYARSVDDAGARLRELGVWVVGLIIWIFIPARAESPWRQKQARKAAAVDAAELAEERK